MGWQIVILGLLKTITIMLLINLVVYVKSSCAFWSWLALTTASILIHEHFTLNVLQCQFFVSMGLISELLVGSAFFFFLIFFKFIKILRIYHLLFWMTCFSDSSLPLFKNKACNYCLNTFECICLSLVLVIPSEFSVVSDCLKFDSSLWHCVFTLLHGGSP